MKKTKYFISMKIFTRVMLVSMILLTGIIMAISLFPSFENSINRDTSLIFSSPPDDNPNIPIQADSPSSSNLNTSVILNQSAYLPGAIAQINLTLTNNFDTTLENVSIQGILPETIQIIEGGLNYSQSQLAPNETAINSLEIQVPTDNSFVDSLDVVFLIDSSGSMSEELDNVKSEVNNLVAELEQKISTLRVGFVMFGSNLFDENPYSDTRNILSLTSDLNIIENFIGQFSARGGWEPWGDALHYLYQMDWEATARLAILITDEPCNPGYYIGTDSNPGIGEYDGEALYTLVEELHEDGLIIGTMKCYGGGDLLTSQLTQIAEIGKGLYVELSGDSSELIDNAILMCEAVIQETGLRIQANYSVIYQGEVIQHQEEKYILIDNEAPRMKLSYSTYYIKENDTLVQDFKLICQLYDSSSVDEVTGFYRINKTGMFTTILMNKSSGGLFYYNLPHLPKNTIVEFYCFAADRLGNSNISEIFEFTITFESPIDIGLNSLIRITLEKGEFSIYNINIHQSQNSRLFFIGTQRMLISFQSDMNTNFSKEMELNDSNYFIWEDLSGFHGNLTLICQALENPIGASTNIKLFYSEITNVQEDTNGFESQEINIVPYFPYLFKIHLDANQSNGFHVNVSQTSEFQFYYMGICNSSHLLKSHIFTVISTPITTSGDYYVFLVNLDSASSNFEIVVNFGYGQVDDDPIWLVDQGLDEGGPIPSYPIGILLSILGLCLVWKSANTFNSIKAENK